MCLAQHYFLGAKDKGICTVASAAVPGRAAEGDIKLNQEGFRRRSWRSPGQAGDDNTKPQQEE